MDWYATPQQIAERRWGRPGDLPRTIPRNPTAYERRGGAPALTPAEWATLREWQRKTRRKWLYDPAARVEREAFEVAHAAGTPLEALPLLSPEPPLGLEQAA